MHRSAQHPPCIRAQPRGDIDSQHRRARAIDSRYRLYIVAAHIAAQTGSQQGVDDHPPRLQGQLGEIDYPDAIGERLLSRQQRIADDFFRVSHLKHCDPDASFVTHIRNQETITTIVARTAKNLQTSRVRPGVQQAPERGLCSARHQHDTRNIVIMDSAVIQSAGLYCGIHCFAAICRLCQNYTHKPTTGRSHLPQAPRQQNTQALVQKIREWATELGFQQLAITGVDLGAHEGYLQKWLDAGYHGSMEYMARHGSKRSRPDELVPGTLRVISLRMNYLTPDTQALEVLASPQKAYISRYTLGRDYHKLIRKRLSQLASRIEAEMGGGEFRAFVDSAPVLERAVAEKAGLGWIAKNTMLINRDAGSWFFLGEIFTDLPLPLDAEQGSKHCGTCTACLDVCPTNAFTGPFQLDARKCISYLTIEHHGSIDPDLRPLMGNRIFGCDDCQLCCPWNKFAQATGERDFQPRHGLADVELVELFEWDEQTFLANTEGSAIRRIGYERWLRNLAVALGNAPHSDAVINALQGRRAHTSLLVQEHVAWALQQHGIMPA